MNKQKDEQVRRSKKFASLIKNMKQKLQFWKNTFTVSANEHTIPMLFKYIIIS